MMKIVTYPAKVLRKKIPEVGEVGVNLLKEIEEVTKVLKSKEESAAGLAATQLGFESRFFAQKEGDDNKIVVYVNPKITKYYGSKTYPIMVFDDGKKEEFLEGCLSFPNIFGTVKRFLKVEVEWQEIVNEKLETRNKVLEGFEAIVFQHEAEHLNGILFIDHIFEEKGKVYKFEGNKKKLIKIEEVA